MERHKHEATAVGALSSAILPWVGQPERVGDLRQYLSKFTHRCRNSLHGIKMSLYLCRRAMQGPAPETWTLLERTYRETERLLDRLHDIYRPMYPTMVRSSLGQLLGPRITAWRASFAERGIHFEAVPPAEEPLGDYDPMCLGSGLDAFVAWRLEDRSSCRSVRVAWQVNEGCFEIAWREVGQRVRDGVADCGNPGFDGSAGSRSSDSLALPLLVRIASAHGGRVTYRWDPAFQLLVLWPQCHMELKSS